MFVSVTFFFCFVHAPEFFPRDLLVNVSKQNKHVLHIYIYIYINIYIYSLEQLMQNIGRLFWVQRWSQVEHHQAAHRPQHLQQQRRNRPGESLCDVGNLEADSKSTLCNYQNHSYKSGMPKMAALHNTFCFCFVLFVLMVLFLVVIVSEAD